VVLLRHVLSFVVRRSLPYLRRYSPGPIFCVPGDVIGDEIFLEGLYEGELLTTTFDVLLGGRRRQFADSVCLDIGANIGNHSLFLQKRFATVLAFEPNPVFCLAFRATMACNGVQNVRLFEVGLGAAPERLPYMQAAPNNLGGSRFLKSGEADTTGMTASLEIVRGDDLLTKEELPPISFIKIDVEGLELEVLTELRKILERHSPLIAFESHPELDRAAAEAVLAHLQQLGYAFFYTCERQRVAPQASMVKKVLNRLQHGWRSRPTQVRELDTREYLMLVASKTRLLEDA
jgi:FkbM family methyltransferase